MLELPVGLPSDAVLDEAAEVLRRGLLVVLPTDTVYGVAALPQVEGATARLFAAKGRGPDVPIAVLVADLAQALGLSADLPSEVSDMLASHWPGALTAVLPRAPGLDLQLGHPVETVGVRCPASDFVRLLARRVGPIATSSANRHGEPTPSTAAGVGGEFGDAVALVVDGGECAGTPSTVIDFTAAPPVVRREGALTAAALGLARPTGDP
jgi:tRNA threonylcarbamoyl adenosine modification protein (Sua5/YciO/YrdC/YwlC family)